MEKLKGKRVRLSMSVWEIDGLRPCPYEATLSDVSGTMILLTEFVTGVGKHKVPDTWVNTASHLLNFIQAVE